MSFLSKVIYHFFNIIFKVLLVCTGLIFLVVGINLFLANAAANANKLHLNINLEPVHLELPAFVPERIKEPVDQVQAKLEVWLADIVNLDNTTMFLTAPPTETSEENVATSTESLPATESPTPPSVIEEVITTEPVFSTEEIVTTETPTPPIEG